MSFLVIEKKDVDSDWAYKMGFVEGVCKYMDTTSLPNDGSSIPWQLEKTNYITDYINGFADGFERAEKNKVEKIDDFDKIIHISYILLRFDEDYNIEQVSEK